MRLKTWIIFEPHEKQKVKDIIAKTNGNENLAIAQMVSEIGCTASLAKIAFNKFLKYSIFCLFLFFTTPANASNFKILTNINELYAIVFGSSCMLLLTWLQYTAKKTIFRFMVTLILILITGGLWIKIITITYNL